MATDGNLQTPLARPVKRHTGKLIAIDLVAKDGSQQVARNVGSLRSEY